MASGLGGEGAGISLTILFPQFCSDISKTIRFIKIMNINKVVVHKISDKIGPIHIFDQPHSYRDMEGRNL